MKDNQTHSSFMGHHVTSKNKEDPFKNEGASSRVLEWSQ